MNVTRRSTFSIHLFIGTLKVSLSVKIPELLSVIQLKCHDIQGTSEIWRQTVRRGKGKSKRFRITQEGMTPNFILTL